MKKLSLLLWSVSALTLPAVATPVKVTMNAISTTMTLVDKATDESVEIGTPNSKVYSFEAPAGVYLLTGYATDGKTSNGSILLDIPDATDTQEYVVFTCTAYVTNKNTDNKTWSIENGDYTLDVKVNTREGENLHAIPGKSTTADRYTFLTLSGNSYNASFIPNAVHQAEGYMTLYKGGTITMNANVNGAIPMGGNYEVTVPADAHFQMGMKFTHFTDFTPIEPDKVEYSGSNSVYKYTLANGQIYNYRTWKAGGLTHAGYFTMSTDATKCPEIAFSEADYTKHDPKAINHDAQSNAGYETGDIFLNINPQGYINMQVGEEYPLHAMRTWELTDSGTGNYFFEPDFHYTILNSDFQPSSDVIEIETSDPDISPWTKIKAKAQGTAIVLVTYDGINVNYYTNKDKKEILGGEYWGAIWPENTGVFVVSVGESGSAIQPEMIVNEQMNVEAFRLAGKYVDAEHDVFYYLDSEEGYPFTFTPQGVQSVTVASPEVSESALSFAAFGSDNVVKNDDGSYTVLLKNGRNIVKLADNAGNSVYQILTAKECHRELLNVSRPGSKIYQPGDEVKVQYKGLFHPANKLAGIYNMSAYVTYNGVPNGSSLILGSGQYIFGSAASAQAVSVKIPEDHDVNAAPELIMSDGVIQVNGYGDPIGNHRNISQLAGRSPNFTAVAHKSYFGAIPDIRIPVSSVKLFDIKLQCNVADADIKLSFDNKALTPEESGLYIGTYGYYNAIAQKDGYRCFRQTFSIGDDAQGEQVFDINMTEAASGTWDGKTITEVIPDANGVYHISTGAELAYIASTVAEQGAAFTASIVMDNDIDLGDFDWTPIGNNSKSFSGKFDGAGHRVKGLYINTPASNYVGLFGYVKGTEALPASITNLTVEGSVTGKQYTAGIAGYLHDYASVGQSGNLADVNGYQYVGGVAGSVSSATAAITDCYNQANITAEKSACGGIAGNFTAKASIQNVYSTGQISCPAANSTGSCVGGTASKANVINSFANAKYGTADEPRIVTEAQLASGEVTYKLGDNFYQTIGVDLYPVLNGNKVYYDEADEKYYNLATDFIIGSGEGNDDIEVTENGIVMAVTDIYQLNVTAIPSEARLPQLSWTSSQPEIVEVSADGLIKALAKGEATITAAAQIDDKTVTSTCNVIVKAASVTKLAFEMTELTLRFPGDETTEISVNFEPSYAEVPQVRWTSSDENVVTVQPNTASRSNDLSATLKAVNYGEAEIKVEQVENPDVAAICNVLVTFPTNVDNIWDDNIDALTDVYDFSGKVIVLDADKESLKKLSPGYYIMRRNGIEKKVILK